MAKPPSHRVCGQCRQTPPGPPVDRAVATGAGLAGGDRAGQVASSPTPSGSRPMRRSSGSAAPLPDPLRRRCPGARRGHRRTHSARRPRPRGTVPGTAAAGRGVLRPVRRPPHRFRRRDRHRLAPERAPGDPTPGEQGAVGGISPEPPRSATRETVSARGARDSPNRSHGLKPWPGAPHDRPMGSARAHPRRRGCWSSMSA